MKSPAATLLAVVLALSACAATPGPRDVSAASRSVVAPAEEALALVRGPDSACLAEAIYFEAGQSRAGFEAVAHVILNRSRDPRFPGSVCGVISDRCQFSYRCEGKDLTLVNPERRARAHRVAAEVLSGAPDPTSGALFFHASYAAPDWFRTRPRIGEFGGNVFYR